MPVTEPSRFEGGRLESTDRGEEGGGRRRRYTDNDANFPGFSLSAFWLRLSSGMAVQRMKLREL